MPHTAPSKPSQETLVGDSAENQGFCFPVLVAKQFTLLEMTHMARNGQAADINVPCNIHVQIEDSEFSSLTVSSGDVIVMGSDGLLDNLGDMDMAREISDMMRQVSTTTPVLSHESTLVVLH